MSEQVEWALHCCITLTLMPDGQPVSTTRLGELHGIPTAYLAKALQALSKAGITEAIPGRKGGYRLARDAATISFLDIIDAVEGGTAMFRCTEIRRNLPTPRARALPVCPIASAMYQAENAWREALDQTSLRELCTQVRGTTPSAQSRSR